MQQRKENITTNKVFGEPKPRAEIISEINSDDSIKNMFDGFNAADRERILCFLEGSASLQILEDSFFQHVFRPDTAPERIESLLSAVLGQKVKVVTTLPREGTQITDEGSQVVMDIIVKLEDGSIANVEMQRIGFKFPGERTNCYLADMTMRQYNKTRSAKGKDFSYKDMRPIRLIVIMDESSSEFRSVRPEYIHTRAVSYSSGAQVTDLEKVTYISLGTYRETAQNEINTALDAWLTFFSFEDTDHVLNLVDSYPEFLPLYEDIAEFRKHPKEVLGMFSEALKIMDRNTTKYMFEELHETVANLRQTIEEKDHALEEKDQVIESKDQTISDKDALIDRLTKFIADNNLEFPTTS